AMPRPAFGGPALLTVNVGNYHTALGVFQEEELVLSWTVRSVPRTVDETLLFLRQFLAPESIDLAGLPTVLCSVVPALTADLARALETLTDRAPLEVRGGSVPGLTLRYHQPDTVGPDRLANAVAARQLLGA